MSHRLLTAPGVPAPMTVPQIAALAGCKSDAVVGGAGRAGGDGVTPSLLAPAVPFARARCRLEIELLGTIPARAGYLPDGRGNRSACRSTYSAMARSINSLVEGRTSNVSPIRSSLSRFFSRTRALIWIFFSALGFRRGISTMVVIDRPLSQSVLGACHHLSYNKGEHRTTPLQKRRNSMTDNEVTVAHATGVAEEFCESPIERAFLVAYARVVAGWDSLISYAVKRGETGISAKAGYDATPVIQPTSLYHRRQTDLIWVQLPVENYRLDFAIARIGIQYGFKGDEPTGLVTVKTPILVVECDGHDFHDRTKEQAQRDRSRDRDLTALGYRVVRFTGSEIHRDPDACAREVDNLLDSLAASVART